MAHPLRAIQTWKEVEGKMVVLSLSVSVLAVTLIMTLWYLFMHHLPFRYTFVPMLLGLSLAGTVVGAAVIHGINTGIGMLNHFSAWIG